MKYLRSFAWIGFSIIVLFYLFQWYVINKLYGLNFNIVCLELATAATGKAYVIYLASNNILKEAIINTKVDCLFIICYVILLITVSYSQMQREKSFWLNTLLRLNFPLAILAGFCDYIENSLLFYDFHFYKVPSFYPSHWVSIIKFLLAGWVLLVWIISVIKGAFMSKKLQLLKHSVNNL
jgi:hypothetical protein